jgi:N-acetylglucosaminyl-diphospho-decaprenol L-rhamnosyltransferase
VKISIIIVSYNVKYFLEQCLCSVKKAIGSFDGLSAGSIVNLPGRQAGSELEVEIFVVDNNSSDGTLEYLQAAFPLVKFISNQENTGFSRANNQALQLATGQFVLFLNPDTILPENFFSGSIEFMKMNDHIGAIGVQMIDGSGKFLKESKRGFPTTWTAFCRLSGLTGIFPRSKYFARYYLGHLDRNANHEADALSGACMMIRKEVLDKTGGFDERFFMYAEDIDLSYRIRQAGYANYYLSEITIIHFKGESTTKDIAYVKLFYKAMIQFVQKHYKGISGQMYAQLLKIAIWSRALFTAGTLPLTRQKLVGERKIFFKGDNYSIAEVKHSLPDLNHTVVQSIDEANEIILCEGKKFSFIEIIEHMKNSPGKNYKIHASGSSSELMSRCDD